MCMICLSCDCVIQENVVCLLYYGDLVLCEAYDVLIIPVDELVQFAYTMRWCVFLGSYRGVYSW